MSAFFYIPSLLKEGLIVTSIFWDLLSVIGFLIIGLVIFKESLNPWQAVGAALGVIAIVVLLAGR